MTCLRAYLVPQKFSAWSFMGSYKKGFRGEVVPTSTRSFREPGALMLLNPQSSFKSPWFLVGNEGIRAIYVYMYIYFFLFIN